VPTGTRISADSGYGRRFVPGGLRARLWVRILVRGYGYTKLISAWILPIAVYSLGSSACAGSGEACRCVCDVGWDPHVIVRCAAMSGDGAEGAREVQRAMPDRRLGWSLVELGEADSAR
jgi:hypothetical protein